MIRSFFLLLICLLSVPFLSAQTADFSWKYPEENGRILYEYSGNTEGYRELFFRKHGAEQAMFTNLSRTSTFFAVQTTTPENVIEIMVDGTHHHFDLDTKNGIVLDFPIHLLHKYFRLEDSKPFDEGLLEIGAEYIAPEDYKGFPCEKWTYRGREIWIWEGLLLKMKSSGLNKNFTLEAVEFDFEQEVLDEKFVFPVWFTGE